MAAKPFLTGQAAVIAYGLETPEIRRLVLDEAIGESRGNAEKIFHFGLQFLLA
jgi:hypothetical protein